MAKRDKETLKGYFKTGAIPTEANFGDLIDSSVEGEATTTAAGLMSAADKVRLDGMPSAQGSRNGDTGHYVYSVNDPESKMSVLNAPDTMVRPVNGKLMMQKGIWNPEGASLYYSRNAIPGASTSADGVLTKEVFNRLGAGATIYEGTATSTEVPVSYPNWASGGARTFTLHAATSARAGVMTAAHFSFVSDLKTAYSSKLSCSGYYGKNGKFSDNVNYGNSGLIPVKRGEPITVTARGTGNLAAITLFDAGKQFISCVMYTGSNQETHTIEAEEILETAAFYVISAWRGDSCTYTQPYADEGEVNAVSEAIYRAGKQGLIAMCRSMGMTYDTATGLFGYNGLTDIIEAQAMDIIAAGRLNASYANSGYAFSTIRTNLTCVGNYHVDQTYTATFYACKSLEVANLNPRFQGGSISLCAGGAYMFANCVKLRTVMGAIKLIDKNAGIYSTMFNSCMVLETVKFNAAQLTVATILNLHASPRLSLESLQSIVTTTTGAALITVRVHADVYAKLTGDTSNEAAAALTEEELAQWTQALADATAKNVSFAK